MQPTQTGIATALALTVVIFFFIFNGTSMFAPAPTSDANLTFTDPNATTTMPTDSAPVTELMVRDEVVGTGATATTGDTVTVNYVGALTNGSVFDSSANHPETAAGFVFTLGQGRVIPGWEQGILGMKVGGKRLLVIPASLGYGAQANGPIPANSTLIFQVELLNVQKTTQ
jgi:FKBP-type peptidyl-prolyl cis-trans isomerase